MKVRLIAALVCTATLATAADASFISYGVGSLTPDGDVSASAQFTTSNNGTLTIVLNNLMSAIMSPGQMLSDLTFTFGGTTPGPLTLVSQSGTLVTVTGSTVAPISGSPISWHLFGTGIEAIGGGQPSYMIVGPSPDCNAGCSNFNPYINLSGTFVLSAANLTAATTITSAMFSFGTGPDFFRTGTVCTSSTQPNCGGTPAGDVPEPSSAALSILGVGLLAAALLNRRRSFRTQTPYR